MLVQVGDRKIYLGLGGARGLRYDHMITAVESNGNEVRFTEQMSIRRAGYFNSDVITMDCIVRNGQLLKSTIESLTTNTSMRPNPPIPHRNEPICVGDEWEWKSRVGYYRGNRRVGESLDMGFGKVQPETVPIKVFNRLEEVDAFVIGQWGQSKRRWTRVEGYMMDHLVGELGVVQRVIQNTSIFLTRKKVLPEERYVLVSASRGNQVGSVQLKPSQPWWRAFDRRQQKLTTDLCWAASRLDRKEVERLIKSGASVEGRRGNHRATPLLLAASSPYGDRAERVIALLEAGVDVNVRSRNGVTPLMAASLEGYDVVAEQLLAHGADVNAMDDSGDTALMAAVVKGTKLGMVSRLLKSGADVNAVNNHGQTALSMARDGRIVKLLWEHGAIKRPKPLQFLDTPHR